MAACPLCSQPAHLSTKALDDALLKVDEHENTIIRLENRGLINFIAGLAIGFAAGGCLVLTVNHFKKDLSHEPIRQVSPSRTDTGR